MIDDEGYNNHNPTSQSHSPTSPSLLLSINAVAELIESSRSLKEVDLRWNDISQEGRALCLTAAKMRKTFNLPNIFLKLV